MSDDDAEIDIITITSNSSNSNCNNGNIAIRTKTLPDRKLPCEAGVPPQKRRRWKVGTPLILDCFLGRANLKLTQILLDAVSGTPSIGSFKDLALRMEGLGLKVSDLVHAATEKYAEPNVIDHVRALGMTYEEALAVIMCTDHRVVNVIRVWGVKGLQKNENNLAVYSSFIRLVISGLRKLRLVPVHMLGTNMFVPSMLTQIQGYTKPTTLNEKYVYICTAS